MDIVSEERARAAHYFQKAARSKRHRRKFLSKANAWLTLAVRIEEMDRALKGPRKTLGSPVEEEVPKD